MITKHFCLNTANNNVPYGSYCTFLISGMLRTPFKLDDPSGLSDYYQQMSVFHKFLDLQSFTYNLSIFQAIFPTRKVCNSPKLHHINVNSCMNDMNL